MIEEMEGLDKNKTWDIIDLPECKRTIGYKWVHTLKYNPVVQCINNKARLVSKSLSHMVWITLRCFHPWQS